METTPTPSATHCTRCGNEFGEEELENPHLDKGWDNEPICDGCYQNEYESWCPLCEEYFDKPLIHEPCQYLFANEGVEVKGIYKVLKWPFYTSDMLSAWYNDDAIELAKPLPDEEEEMGGFICSDCVKEHQLIPA